MVVCYCYYNNYNISSLMFLFRFNSGLIGVVFCWG
ncbi:hypothetical protein BVRB_6g138590 [Beta vulgaris subsp. vulgaris]|nr:hypothetical protein BVRB_6g138590 [Beta vulgaris subsp. vulgaris]